MRDALSPEALDVVLAHPWPGNFRELENFVARLPAVRRPGTIFPATCHAALAEGAAQSLPPPVAGPWESDPSPLEKSTWDEAVSRASSAWREDHDGAAPVTLGSLKDWLDGYLKPVLAAQIAGIDKPSTLASGINYSALGRQMDVGDGSTVKRWIDRYLSRFGTRP